MTTLLVILFVVFAFAMYGVGRQRADAERKAYEENLRMMDDDAMGNLLFGHDLPDVKSYEKIKHDVRYNALNAYIDEMKADARRRRGES